MATGKGVGEKLNILFIYLLCIWLKFGVIKLKKKGPIRCSQLKNAYTFLGTKDG